MYCIDPNSDEPIFCLFDAIGVDEKKPLEAHVDGNQFARELLYMDGEGKKRIQIWINCEGGSIKDGMSIIGAILATKTRVDTLVIGIAYSMGGFIALMGKKKEALDCASLMLHYGYNPDNSTDDTLKALNSGLISAVMSRLSKDDSQVKEILAAETFYTAKPEGKQVDIRTLGFEVIKSNEKNAPREPKALHAFGMSYVNKYLAKNKNQMEKSEICELLGLDANVSDAVAMDALKKFKAKADKAIKAVAKGEDDSEDKKAADKLKAENEEMKAKMKAAEDKETARADAEDKAKAVAKATTEITAKAKERNLDEKAISNYVALAGHTPEGLAKVIETIEAIKVVKTAAKLKEIKSINAKADSIAIAMIEDGEAETKSPLGIAAGDTSKMVQGINSFNFHKDWTNRKQA